MYRSKVYPRVSELQGNRNGENMQPHFTSTDKLADGENRTCKNFNNCTVAPNVFFILKKIRKRLQAKESVKIAFCSIRNRVPWPSDTN